MYEGDSLYFSIITLRASHWNLLIVNCQQRDTQSSERVIDYYSSFARLIYTNQVTTFLSLNIVKNRATIITHQYNQHIYKIISLSLAALCRSNYWHTTHYQGTLKILKMFIAHGDIKMRHRNSRKKNFTFAVVTKSQQQREHRQ